MATNSLNKNIAKVFGPAGGRWMLVDFTTSGAASAVTVNEQQGATVSRTGVGTFTISLPEVFKHVTVAMSVQASTTAQLFILSARDLTAKTITLLQVTAGGGTATDALAARINVIIYGRKNS